MRACRRDDQGNISVLTLGMMVVVLVLVLTISAATNIHLQRMRLMHLADESALAAADALDVDAYYRGLALAPTDDAGVMVSEVRIAQAVREHVAAQSARLGTTGVDVLSVRTIDDHTVEVTLRAVVLPLFGLEVLAPWAQGVEVIVTASARAH